MLINQQACAYTAFIPELTVKAGLSLLYRHYSVVSVQMCATRIGFLLEVVYVRQGCMVAGPRSLSHSCGLAT